MNHRFFLPQAQIEHPASIITGAGINHIKNVLRLKPGDHIVIFDGTGAEYMARIRQLASDKVVVDIAEKMISSSESPVHISLAQAYLKEKKMDMLVRQATELGINHWQPFFSERSIPKPDKNRMYSRAQRWEKIMIEAVKQCRRSCLMEIGRSLLFDEVLLSANHADVKAIFWENTDKPILSSDFSFETIKIRSVYFVMGPEGGFSAGEVKKAIGAGFVPVKMGPRILRAETATVAACTIMQYLFGDFGEKSLDKTD
jgi:16S rRNA (uracil1498-N3)-methyltransferase